MSIRIINGEIIKIGNSDVEISSSGISSISGNFTTLQVNGTGVSLSGHTHTASNITDFNSSVSGLLPVKNIVAGSNITISSSSGVFTINSTGGGGAATETIHPFLLGGM